MNLFEEQIRLEQLARRYAEQAERVRYARLQDEERAMQEEEDKRRQYEEQQT